MKNNNMKTTLITGASKGIGNNLVKHFLKKNHKLITISRSDLQFKNQNNIIHIKTDINSNKCKNLIKEIIKNEEINNCILNAGITKNNFFHKMDFKDWKDVINTNLISTYNILNPVINNMRKYNNGNIILLSSVVAKTGIIGSSNYVTSKSGMYGLIKSLSLENAQKNILINAISPGYFNIGMGLEFNETHKQKIKKKIPLKEFGNINDLINIIDFLTEKNNYITGSNIDINGGII